MINHLLKMKPLRNNAKGVVLLEVLIASFILGLLAIPLAKLFLTGAIMTESVKKADTAVYLAQGIIEEHKATPYQEVRSSVGKQACAGHPGYKYTLSVAETNAWLKEVKVTIYYTDAGKEKELELATMMANYDGNCR